MAKSIQHSKIQRSIKN